MRRAAVLTYLHNDHLGSTVLTTNASGNSQGAKGYLAYGRDRTGNELATENRFTGQKGDGTGLQYFNARYYDPQLGTFISPDTLVPDPTNVFDYNRYMYTRGNPLRYNDPTGHTIDDNCGPPVCDAEWFTYSNAPVVVNQVVDAVAWVGCLFTGCHVDTEKDSVSGPTKAEHTQNMINGAMGAGFTALQVPGVLNGTSFVDDAVVAAGKFFNDYNPSATTGFSGVFDPVTDNFLIRPSGDTLLKSGEIPIGRVNQFGGHGTLNNELSQTLGVDPSKTLGFSVFYDTPGQLSISWNSGSVNFQNYSVRAVPEQYRQQIIGAIQKATGLQVKPR